MDLLPALLLRILHFLYALISLIHSFWKRQTRPCPQPLNFPRPRTPKNLALVFVTDPNVPPHTAEKTVLQSVLNAVDWCRTVGIPKLTVYEEHGLMHHLEPQIREAIHTQHSAPPSSNSDDEYQPLTPPSSDYSDSRQLSPCHNSFDITQATVIDGPTLKKGQLPVPHPQPPITLCLLSSRSSKSAIANTARSLFVAQKRKPTKSGQRTKKGSFALTVDSLDSLLEDHNGLSSPDFMLVHPINPPQYNRTPLELHGFPPWHIRLTEIYHNKYFGQPRAWRVWLQNRLTYTPSPTTLDEISFRYALDDFAAAEMRFGK